MKPQVAILGVMMLVLASCGTYFKITETVANGNHVSGAIKFNRFIIVHHNEDVWHLMEAQIDSTNETLIGMKVKLESEHLNYLQLKNKSHSKFKWSQGNPTNEVHLYISECSYMECNAVSIPIGSINKMDVYGKDKIRSNIPYFQFSVWSLLLIGPLLIYGIMSM